MNDSIYSKSTPLHQINIWNDNTNNEVNGSCLTNSITNTINIEHYDLWSDFVIQSRNVSNQKSQTIKNDNFIKSSYSMRMEEFEYCSLLRKLNGKKKLIFNDVMHRK
jgi:hypothetical protein